jgi:hypothetical protein
MTSDDVRVAEERCRDLFPPPGHTGPAFVDFENLSVECVRDLYVLAQAWLRSTSPSGPPPAPGPSPGDAELIVKLRKKSDHCRRLGSWATPPLGADSGDEWADTLTAAADLIERLTGARKGEQQ